MAVDTAAKRYSANAQRWGRLPFGRRFSPPLPDGTVGQGDRQHLGWAYSGISASELVNYFPSGIVAGSVYPGGMTTGQSLSVGRAVAGSVHGGGLTTGQQGMGT